MGICMKCKQRCRHSVGAVGTSLLILPILLWVWPVAKLPAVSVFNGTVPRYIMSGKLSSEQFDIGHAGFSLDQPTIGKWLFWFTVMSVSSLPYAAVVRWFNNSRSWGGRFAYRIAIAVLCTLLLCILSWPLCWLIQYVYSMGSTPRRVYGLLYAIAGAILVIGFFVWAIRKPKEQIIA